MRATLSIFLLIFLLAPELVAQAPPTQLSPTPGNEQRWKTEHEAGLKAIEQGLYSQAVRSFQNAIGEAEKFGSTDPRLAQSLGGMAQAYMLQRNFGAAERLWNQALAIQEIAGPNDPNTAMLLNSLATLKRLQENYPEAAALSRRSLAILEKLYGTQHPNVAIGQNNLAMILRLNGDYEEARYRLQQSLSILEKALGPEHVNVAISLNNLVQVHLLQGDFDRAEPLARRALSIFEKTPGAGTSNLLQSLENLAQVCRELGKYEESEQLYRRVLSVHWGNGTDLVPVLDRFADMLNLAFTEMPLEEAWESFRASSGWNGMREELYVLMNRVLRDRGLTTEPEDVLRRAIRTFPNSLEPRYELAGLFSETHRWQTALEILEEAAKLKGPEDAGRDRYLRTRIHQEIARMHTSLFEFEEATSSFKTALEIDPGNAQALIDFGNLYLKLDKPEEAGVQFAQAVLITGGSAAAYYGIAEVNRRQGHYPEAVLAADKALAINPKDSKSSYVRSVALLQSDRAEEGEAELKRFNTLEANERDEAVRGRMIPVTLDTAFVKLEEGKAEEALEALRDGVKSYPDSASLQLNLGVMQSRLGLHEDALKTFRTMIDNGEQDYFLVHFNLAREYKELGDTKTSQLHRLIYLQKYDAFLTNTRR